MLGQAKKLNAKVKKIKGRKVRIFRRKTPTKVLKKLAIRKLKLKVLYAIEHRARTAPKHKIMADDPESIPENVDADPASDHDDSSDTADTSAEMAASLSSFPVIGWVGVGLAGVLLAVLLRGRAAA